MKLRGVFIVLVLAISFAVVRGQNTEFSYQGQLQNSAAVANGVFDFEFALYGSAFGGAQLGPTQTRSGVNVVGGIFSVSLDFGSQFDGTARFVEIRVRQSGGGAFVTLAPRQNISSAPYAVRSLDAQNASNAVNSTNAINATNAVTAANFSGPLAGDVTGTQNSTTVARLRGTNVAATPPANNQVLKFNSGANQWQPATDETGSGGGGTITGVTAGTALTGGGTTGSVTVGVANGGIGTVQLADLAVSNAKIFEGAVTDAKIASGQVVKSVNSLRDNVTLAAGSNVTITPSGNTLTIASTGVNAILNQTTPQPNSNFSISGNGTAAGVLTGNVINSASQYRINGQNILKIDNSTLMLGINAGGNPINGGASNVFVGTSAGASNTTGEANSFLGTQAGLSNGSGSDNVFVGESTGITNTGGSKNTLIGNSANVGSGSLTNATAIGANASVQSSNSLVLGSITGVNGATSNSRVGIGVAAPNSVLHIRGDGPNGLGTGDLLIEGFGSVGSAISLRSNFAGREYSWIATGPGASSGAGRLAAFDVTAGAYRMVIDNTGRVGIGTTSPDNLLTVNGTANKPGGGSWGTFSDERLKNIQGSFTAGLSELMTLEPIRYKYKPSNSLDLNSDTEHIGFSAQAVKKVIPEAVSTTDKGYLLLNNDPILWTMLNSIKEQQATITALQKQVAAQNLVIERLEVRRGAAARQERKRLANARRK